MDISVVLPVLNEAENLRRLLPRMRDMLRMQRLDFEVLVIDGGSRDDTRATAAAQGARVLSERFPGYAGALVTGFDEARGDYVLTLDADLSHEPSFVAKMWRARQRADIVIASRYVRGGVCYTSLGRRVLSRLLNLVLSRMLSLPVRDISSGFRLYRREALKELSLEGRNFEVLEEILVKAYASGFSVIEVPFTYFPRGDGTSHARLIKFGYALFRSSIRLWRLRNSLASADYDERAFYSLIPVQRYWQRRRHHIISGWARHARRVLDVGCGSSVIIQSLNNPVALDYKLAKVRYVRRYGVPVLQASAFALPFKPDSFDCLISSQVIEHIPFDEVLFDEMCRVLEPGGTLILGTPDYDTLSWRIIEPIYGRLMPGGYHDEHITHYTRRSLRELLARRGMIFQQAAYIGGGELILRYQKPLAEPRCQPPADPAVRAQA